MNDIDFINSPEVKEVINKLSNSIRAERNESDSFLKIYADKSILQRLNNHNNQIVYGRRGSGKTHLLLALAETLVYNSSEAKKVVPVFVDLRK